MSSQNHGMVSYDPFHDRTIPATFLGLMRDENIAFAILDYVLDDSMDTQETIVFQFRARYVYSDPPNRQSISQGPGSLNIVRAGRITSLVWGQQPTTYFLRSLPRSGAQPGDEYNGLAEYNLVLLWQFSAPPSDILDRSNRPSQISSFAAVRLTSRDMYSRAWEWVRTHGLVAQILSPINFDLRLPTENASLNGVWHIPIHAIESVRTLMFGPTFSAHMDYSQMIQRLPRLEYIIPGSIHIITDGNRAFFNARALAYGLMCKQEIAQEWALALVDRLIPQNMMTLPEQNVYVIRQISFLAGRDHSGTIINLVVGFRLCTMYEPHNKPFIITAHLQRRVPGVSRPCFPHGFLKFLAEAHFSFRRNPENRAVDCTMVETGQSFTNRTAHTALMEWQRWMQFCTAFPGWNLPDYVTLVFRHHHTISNIFEQ